MILQSKCPCTRWPSSYCCTGDNASHDGEGNAEWETISNWSWVNAGSLYNSESGRYRLPYCSHTKSVALCWPKACRQEGLNIRFPECQKECLKIVKYLPEMYSHWLTGHRSDQKQLHCSQIAHDQEGPSLLGRLYNLHCLEDNDECCIHIDQLLSDFTFTVCQCNHANKPEVSPVCNPQHH